MDDKGWDDFWNSGSIFDYLNYKEHEKVQEDVNFYQGISNKGADNRGE